jgi:ADP-ribose pyrophosphatase
MYSKRQIFSQETMYSGRILDVVHRRVRLSSEQVIEYEILHRSNIAIIIPLLPSGDIILLKQFRASIGQEIWEFPAGSIEVGESPLEAAKRELEEETGYQTKEVRLLQTFHTCPHFCDEKAFIFLANVTDYCQPNLQEKEIITSHILSQTQLSKKYYSGEILDAKTIIAYHAFLLNIVRNIS